MPRSGGGGDVKVLSSDLDGVLILGLPAGRLARSLPPRQRATEPAGNVRGGPDA